MARRAREPGLSRSEVGESEACEVEAPVVAAAARAAGHAAAIPSFHVLAATQHAKHALGLALLQAQARELASGEAPGVGDEEIRWATERVVRLQEMPAAPNPPSVLVRRRRGFFSTPWEISLEDHLVEWATNRPRDSDQQAYDLAAIKLIALAETEPALRTAWLMACDRIERELVAIIADRMDREVDEVEVRLHAAAANSVMRVLNEDIGAAILAGDDSASIGNTLERIARAVRVATGGVVGDPADS